MRLIRKSSRRWPSTTRSTKESPADAGCQQRGQQRKVQRKLAVDGKVDKGTSSGRWLLVDEEVGKESPAEADHLTSKVAQGWVSYNIFGSGEESTDYEQANGHFVLYCIILLLELQ